MRAKDVLIRSAQKNDLNKLVDLLAQHAAYEKSEFDPVGKGKQLEQAIFKEKKLSCLVAEYENEVIGYATHMLQYSTWEASEYIYLDCLYFEESARGFGLGERMMNFVAKEARSLSIDLIQWQTPSFNLGAIKFYERIGAKSLDKYRFFWPVNLE